MAADLLERNTSGTGPVGAALSVLREAQAWRAQLAAARSAAARRPLQRRLAGVGVVLEVWAAVWNEGHLLLRAAAPQGWGHRA